MLITFIRAIILYIVVLIVMRLMGKREIGQLQPFELAISIMIADLATIPMTDPGIPITNGIIPILGLLIMHLLISWINIKSLRAREIVCGKPSILIYRGKIDEKALKKERFTINELQERLRGNNIVNIGDVEYAILETSGQVTVIQKPNKRNATPEDFNIMPEYEGIPYDLVVDGKVMYVNLKLIEKDYNWLKKQVNKFGFEPEQALVVTLDRQRSNFLPKERIANVTNVAKLGGKMKKELIIIIMVILLVIIGNVITQNYTKQCIARVNENLEDLKENILSTEKNNTMLKDKMTNIQHEWDEMQEKLAFYIEHDELEKVETQIFLLKGYIEGELYSDTLSEIEKCSFILEHIADKTALDIKNIF